MAVYYGYGTKEGILASLETQMNAIAGIQFVDYQRIEYAGASRDKYPGIYINDLRVDKTTMLEDIIKNIFTVVLVGWIWASTETTLATEMNAFMELTKAKAVADPYQNTNARGTQIVNTATDMGSRYPQGSFMITLTIIFYSRD